MPIWKHFFLKSTPLSLKTPNPFLQSAHRFRSATPAIFDHSGEPQVQFNVRPRENVSPFRDRDVCVVCACCLQTPRLADSVRSTTFRCTQAGIVFGGVSLFQVQEIVHIDTVAQRGRPHMYIGANF